MINNKRLRKLCEYRGCDTNDLEYFKENIQLRLFKSEDGFYIRKKRKNMFYWYCELSNADFIFNLTRIKKKPRNRKGL